jgi:AcrR family transcriptional regulator
MARRNDKRTRLIEAAKTLFHQKGVNVTTLANIASLANVPLGNVYYYFQSKESIIVAVIEQCRKTVRESLQELEGRSSEPKQRLLHLLSCAPEELEVLIAYGDHVGGLCHELSKEGGEVSDSASLIMREIIDWCASQFERMGKSTEIAAELALSFISNLQGSRLLGLTFKNPEYITRQNQYLAQWIQSL